MRIYSDYQVLPIYSFVGVHATSGSITLNHRINGKVKDCRIHPLFVIS